MRVLFGVQTVFYSEAKVAVVKNPCYLASLSRGETSYMCDWQARYWIHSFFVTSFLPISSQVRFATTQSHWIWVNFNRNTSNGRNAVKRVLLTKRATWWRQQLTCLRELFRGRNNDIAGCWMWIVHVVWSTRKSLSVHFLQVTRRLQELVLCFRHFEPQIEKA